jgi:hypothetical protein
MINGLLVEILVLRDFVSWCSVRTPVITKYIASFCQHKEAQYTVMNSGNLFHKHSFL